MQGERSYSARAAGARTSDVYERVPSATLAVEQLLTALLDAVPGFVAQLDTFGDFLFLSRAVMRADVPDMPARGVFEMFGSQSHELLSSCLVRACEQGVAQVLELDAPAVNGACVRYRLQIAPLTGDILASGFTLIASELGTQQAAQAALEESRAQLRVIERSFGLGLFSVDLARDRGAWNDALYGIMGIERDPEGETLASYLRCVHEDDCESVARALERTVLTGEFREFEHRVTRAGGETLYVAVQGEVLRDGDGRIAKLVGSVVDVSERRRLDARMRQAQKLDGVGQLTAGIAHNFNNILTGILPSVELALRDASGRSRGLLENARDASERAARMVRHLLNYAGEGGRSERRLESMVSVVSRTLTFFRATLDRAIEIELRTHPDVPLVTMDANQLEQALLNLLINARDALREVCDRTPRIRVSVEAHAPLISVPGGLADLRGDFVIIRVEDNGSGMDDATRARVFEPFFTTKAEGRGTGLGLAMVAVVLKEHDGAVACESTPGVGTSFWLALPYASPHTRQVDVDTREVDVLAGPRATVLLVDDEEMIRTAVGTLLRDAGHRVMLARDGLEALAMYEAERKDIDLVLLDQSLPGLSGSAVFAGLLAIDPDVCVVSFSGRAEPLSGTMAVVNKPVSSHDLLDTLNDVLQSKQAAHARSKKPERSRAL
jgi:PAS domain S-box-containing protein